MKRFTVAMAILLASCESGGSSGIANLSPTASTTAETENDAGQTSSPSPSAREGRKKRRQLPVLRPLHGFKPAEIDLADVRRFVRFETPLLLSNASSDGLLVAFRTPPDYEGKPLAYVGTLDLRANDVRYLVELHEREVAESKSHITYGDPLISPDGRTIAFREGARLRLVDSRSGETRTVARTIDAWDLRYGWLSDNRLWFVGGGRRLMFVRPGGSPVASGLRLEDPTARKYDNVVRNVAVDPKGKLVLYPRGCAIWVRNLASGRDHLVAKALEVPQNAWAPSGSHFVLQIGESVLSPSCLTRNYWRRGDHDYLFARTGKRVTGSVLGWRNNLSHGHNVSWSPDGRFLFISVQPTGTEVGGYKFLDVALVRPRRRSSLVGDRFVDRLISLPGGWVVFSRYDVAPSSGNDYQGSGAVYVARLVAG